MGNSLNKLTFLLGRLQDVNPSPDGASTTQMLSDKWPARLELYRALFAANQANPGSVMAIYRVVDKLMQRNANMQAAQDKLMIEAEKQTESTLPSFIDKANSYLSGIKLTAATGAKPQQDETKDPPNTKAPPSKPSKMPTGTGQDGGEKDDYDQYVGVKDVNMNDRFVFVAVTYVVRMVCLFMIDWAVSTNMLDNFKDAFLYYIGLYCLMIVFITFVVSNNDIGVQMLLYYMNTEANGYSRIILHLFVVFLLLPIMYIIKESSVNSQVNTTDYEYKARISQSLSTFTMISWMLTSAIALRF